MKFKLCPSLFISCFFLSSFAYGMDQTSEGVEITRYLPANTSENIKKNTSLVYKKISTAAKKEIIHDRPEGLLPNKVYQDYGWNFPPIPRVQKELLEFCSQFPKKVRGKDIGAGEGYDTIAMLFTGKVHVSVYEKEAPQRQALENKVKELMSEANKDFDVSKNTRYYGDFLTAKFTDNSKGQYQVINANKMLHFLDPESTETFGERSAFLSGTDGGLFLTSVTPTPGDPFDTFMKANKEKKWPGYLFYKQENELNHNWTGIVGEPKITLVRIPKQGEKAGHFYQTVEERGSKAFAITERVMHYHTEETLTQLLGDKFKIKKVINLLPKDIHPDAAESMISIVAERTDK